jgi:hypothetical protein
VTRAAAPLKVRVWVPEVWDAVQLTPAPECTVAQLKAEALAQATGRARDPAAYVVKYHGAAVPDEGRTLAQLGVGDGAPFIVLPARRQPVR